MNDNVKALSSATVIIACLAFLAFLVHEKVDGSVVLAVAVVPTLIAYFTRQPEKKDPPAISGIVVTAGVGALIVAALTACTPPTPKQQGAVVDGVCTVLDAFANSPLEEAICADASDLVAIEADVRTTRADASVPDRVMKLAKKGEPCKIVGTVCASEDELAHAIHARKAAKL